MPVQVYTPATPLVAPVTLRVEMRLVGGVIRRTEEGKSTPSALVHRTVAPLQVQVTRQTTSPFPPDEIVMAEVLTSTQSRFGSE